MGLVCLNATTKIQGLCFVRAIQTIGRGSSLKEVGLVGLDATTKIQELCFVRAVNNTRGSTVLHKFFSQSRSLANKEKKCTYIHLVFFYTISLNCCV